MVKGAFCGRKSRVPRAGCVLLVVKAVGHVAVGVLSNIGGLVVGHRPEVVEELPHRGEIGGPVRGLRVEDLASTVRDWDAQVADLDAMRGLPLPSGRGFVTLGEVADVKMAAGPSEIARFNRMRSGSPPTL